MQTKSRNNQIVTENQSQTNRDTFEEIMSPPRISPLNIEINELSDSQKQWQSTKKDKQNKSDLGLIDETQNKKIVEIDEITTPKRKNGYQWPPNIQQISCLLSLILNTAMFYSVTINYLQYQIVFGILYIILMLCVLISAHLTSTIDTEDKLVIQQKMIGGKKLNDSDYEYFCNLCNCVVNEGTKHCRTCNKCVYKFDHHCRWLNTCIGQDNYKPFIIFVILSDLSLILLIALLIIQADTIENTYIYILNIIFIVVNIVSAISVTELLRFHINLMLKSETTLDYLKRHDRVNKNSRIIVKLQQENANKITQVVDFNNNTPKFNQELKSHEDLEATPNFKQVEKVTFCGCIKYKKQIQNNTKILNQKDAEMKFNKEQNASRINIKIIDDSLDGHCDSMMLATPNVMNSKIKLFQDQENDPNSEIEQNKSINLYSNVVSN